MEQSRVLLLLVPVPNISLRHRCGSVYSESIFSSFLSCVAHIRAHREALVSLCAPCFLTLSFDRLQRLLGRRKNLAVPRLHYRRQGGQDTVNTVEICLLNDARAPCLSWPDGGELGVYRRMDAFLPLLDGSSIYLLSQISKTFSKGTLVGVCGKRSKIFWRVGRVVVVCSSSLFASSRFVWEIILP